MAEILTGQTVFTRQKELASTLSSIENTIEDLDLNARLDAIDASIAALSGQLTRVEAETIGGLALQVATIITTLGNLGKALDDLELMLNTKKPQIAETNYFPE